MSGFMQERADANNRIANIIKQEVADSFKPEVGNSDMPATPCPEKKRLSIREIANKHGIDLSRIIEQSDIVDVLTGKRASIE